MSILILILVTLAIIAIVLAVVAMKLIRKPVDLPPAAPVSGASSGAASGTASPVTDSTPVKREPQKTTPKAAPVPERTDGETETFDISAKASAILWICPACGAENSFGSRCQICAEPHV